MWPRWRGLFDQVQQDPPQREAAAGGDRAQGRGGGHDGVAAPRLGLVVVLQLRHRRAGRDAEFGVRVLVGPRVGQAVLGGEDITDPGPLDVLEVAHETVQRQPRGDGRLLHVLSTTARSFHP